MAITSTKLRPLTTVEVIELRGLALSWARAKVRCGALFRLYLNHPSDDVSLALAVARRDLSAAQTTMDGYINELSAQLAVDQQHPTEE
jgi:hypothetical protein